MNHANTGSKAGRFRGNDNSGGLKAWGGRFVRLEIHDRPDVGLTVDSEPEIVESHGILAPDLLSQTWRDAALLKNINLPDQTFFAPPESGPPVGRIAITYRTLLDRDSKPLSPMGSYYKFLANF